MSTPTPISEEAQQAFTKLCRGCFVIAEYGADDLSVKQIIQSAIDAATAQLRADRDALKLKCTANGDAYLAAAELADYWQGQAFKSQNERDAAIARAEKTESLRKFACDD